MSKKVIISLFTILCCVLVVISTGCLLEKTRVNSVLTLLKSYDKNESLAFVGDYCVYLADKTITQDDILEYETEDFLYVTKEKIYFYTLSDDKKTVTVFSTDLELTNFEPLFSKTFEKRPVLYMLDETCVYIRTDGCFRYDLNTNEYRFLANSFEAIRDDFALREFYSVTGSKEGILKNKTQFSITRNVDGVTKILTSADLLENEDAVLMNDRYPLKMVDVVSNEEYLYILCSCYYETAVVFSYHFDTEEIAFCGWREVIDATDGLVTCVLA